MRKWLSSPILHIKHLLQRVYGFLDYFTLETILVIQSLINKLLLMFISHLILSRFLVNLKNLISCLYILY